MRATFEGRVGDVSPVETSGASPSAVLVPLYPSDQGIHVVLTRRASTLRTHQGEVSFPGGRSDPGETPVQTALREAGEEISLDTASATPLGELDHLSTVTRRAYIVPVVAWLEERPELSPSEAEVAAVLHVPLSELLDLGVYREERWGTPPADRPVHFFELQGDTVWGATAAMLRQFFTLALGLPTEPREVWDPAGGSGTGLWAPPAGFLGGVV